LGGTSRALAWIAGLLALAACQRATSTDTMTMLGRCTTHVRSKGPPPQLPSIPAIGARFGVVVGTLADSGGALPHYPVRAVVPGDDPFSLHASATADSLGGFLFDSLPPGRYRLFVRAFEHRPDSLDVRVNAGRVDTLRFVLRFFECVG
jgi:hypothetical protein